MERLWRQLQRPLLAKVVAAYDRGVFTVDPVAYAADLSEPTDRVLAGLTALQVAGFLEIRAHHDSLLITRICPLARQVLCAEPDPIDPDRVPGPVLRAPGAT
ncbi:hypothetical protein ACFQZ4_36925 [Catellatospora coxensis]|uniref:Uncharacterized protein n=1 Tax=Catellatospora coxensis TaxID=310354 RepID=A0A8J3KYP5_9ACTN|nr:hypothetical protein [Catellatospora coxensis]GIG08653.1 hypothetical protein Cco03nite_53530 [Catellatospora coxensis]